MITRLAAWPVLILTGLMGALALPSGQTPTAPLLLVLAVGFPDRAAALFALIPIGVVGALLIFAGTDYWRSRAAYSTASRLACG